MPSVKQGGGYTLTFAKKNEDVKKLLAKKKEDKGFIVTDYICEAIRFFEANKDKIEINRLGSINIEDLVKKEIAKALNNTSIDNDTNEKEISEQSIDLEDDLQDVDIEED